MSDIVIADGLPEEWTLPDTDLENIADANLVNISIGVLALLGATQGTTLRAQTGELQNLINSVNIVNDKLDFLNTTDAWAGTPTALNFPPESIGWPFTSTPFGSNLDLVNKMIAATAQMDQAGVNYRGADAIKYIWTNASGTGFTFYSRPVVEGSLFGSPSGTPPTYKLLQNVSPDNNNITLNNLQSGQLLSLRTSPGGAMTYYRVSTDAQKSLIPVSPPEAITFVAGFAIPQSAAELASWQAQMPVTSSGTSSVQQAFANTVSLTSDQELAPNTLPADPADPTKTNAITMEISPGTAYDMAAYRLPNNQIIYAAYPPQPVQNFGPELLTSQNIGKVFKSSAGTMQYISTDNYGKFIAIDISGATPFFYRPTQDQFTSWRTQYADKITFLTQRSADQQLFVNSLALKYQYSFDAATNVLKAYTNMFATLANNA